jgi:hypothetical protein
MRCGHRNRPPLAATAVIATAGLFVVLGVGARGVVADVARWQTSPRPPGVCRGDRFENCEKDVTAAYLDALSCARVVELHIARRSVVCDWAAVGRRLSGAQIHRSDHHRQTRSRAQDQPASTVQRGTRR